MNTKSSEVRSLIGSILVLTGMVAWAWVATLPNYIEVFLGAALFRFIC